MILTMKKFWSTAIMILMTVSPGGGPNLYAQSPPGITLERAIEMAVSGGNPALRIREAQLEAARAREKQAGLPIIDNPEFEIGVTSSSRRYSRVMSTDPMDWTSNAAQKGSGIEAGITQKLRLSGAQGLQHKVRQNESLSVEYMGKFELIRIKGEVRKQFYRRSAMAAMQSHLEKHVNELKALQTRLGPNFRDPRLGSYAKEALAADIQMLISEHSAAINEFRDADLMLRLLAGIDKESPIEVVSPESFAFPKLPEAQSLIKAAYENRPDLKSLQAKKEAARIQITKEERSRYPDPTVFVYVGQSGYGSMSSTPHYPGPEAEKDQYVKTGIRIPLPIFDTNRYGIDEAKARYAENVAATEYVTKTLETEVISARSRYIELTGNLKGMEKSLDRLENNSPGFSQALINGRIGYFEFFSEHERMHGLLTRYYGTFINSLDALATLENAVGGNLQ